MIEPTERDIGRMVIYRSDPFNPPEEGVITSFNDTCVFVRYRSLTSQATSREDLEWLT